MRKNNQSEQINLVINLIKSTEHKGIIDKELIKLFYPDGKRFVRYYASLKWKSKYSLIWNYINSRFEDSIDYKETFFRLKNNIIIKPKCKQCDNPVAWLKNHYGDFCSISCARSNKDTQLSFKQTCLEKYGAETPMQCDAVKEKIKNTCIKRYGVQSHMQNKEFLEKFKSKCIEKYGVDNYGKIPEAVEKRKLTMIEKFGVDNALRSIKCREKISNTIKNKYGVSNISQVKEIKEKIKQTCIEKYGGVAPACSAEVRNKSKQTCLQKYGVEYASQLDEVKNKVKQTCIERYGVKAPMQNKEIQKKSKETCLKHYGVECYSQTDEFKEKFKSNIKEIQRKAYVTKKKNKSFNCSKQEDYVCDILSAKYDNIIRQYKDNRYPHVCDFYLPDLDLFIEFNGHWTHGKKPFIGNKEDLEKLEYWKSKQSKYYDIAIKVWTVNDVLKRNIAKQNNLNYIEFWNVNEVEEWIKK